MTAFSHPCGCINEVDATSGVLCSVSKCGYHQRHQRDPGSLDGGYYAELRIVEGAHVREIERALGPFPPAPKGGKVLEVGCGASPYAPALKNLGWDYVGVDASPWAARWTANRWGVRTEVSTIEDYHLDGGSYSLVLAAHCLEHVQDSPGTVRRLADALEPSGQLWVVVPDDTDQTNPDHLWFYTAGGLARAVEAAGLLVERLAVLRIVAHERFVYLRATKG
jgi:SAM-dependent methyltransferase